MRGTPRRGRGRAVHDITRKTRDYNTHARLEEDERRNGNTSFFWKAYRNARVKPVAT